MGIENLSVNRDGDIPAFVILEFPGPALAYGLVLPPDEPPHADSARAIKTAAAGMSFFFRAVQLCCKSMHFHRKSPYTRPTRSR